MTPDRAEVAIDPADPAIEAALAADGGLWVSDDAGATWVVAVPPLGGVAPTLQPPDPSDPDDEAEQAEREAVEDLRSEVERRTVRRTWFDGGELWLVREDGARRSADLGRTWVDADLPEGTPPEEPPVAPPATLIVAPVAPVRPRRFARYLPSLVVEVERYARGDRGWDAFTPKDASATRWWTGSAVLQWGLGQPPDPPDLDLDLVDVDGRQILADGTADPVLARAIEDRGAGDAGERAGRAAALERDRAELAGTPEPPALLDRVLRELALQELDAELDALNRD